MALASQWPLRQWLNVLLHGLLLNKAAPALNQGFLDALTVDPARAALPGFVVPSYTDANVTVGELMSTSAPVLCLVPLGRDTDEGPPTQSYTLELWTRLLWKAPQVGLNAPEDVALLNSIMEDTLGDMLTVSQTYALTPTDPITTLPALPGAASFFGCYCTKIRHQPMPVRGPGGTTTYVSGGYADHKAVILLGDDRIGGLT